MWRTDSFEKMLMLGKIEGRGEGNDKGWDGWMTSPTRWTWVWVSSGSWWWTGKPGMLQSMGLQRIGHDWVTEPNWTELQSTRLLCPWKFPGKHAIVGFQFFIQGIFLTQGLNPGLLHCRQILYFLSHQGSPSVKGRDKLHVEDCGQLLRKDGVGTS